MIFVWVEHLDGALSQSSKEALGAASTLGSDITALVFGESVDGVVEQAFHFGADKVVKVADASLAAFRTAPFADLVTALAKEHSPALIVASASSNGRELMGAVSADLDAPLFDDVTEVAVDGNKVTATRPVYAGKVLSTVVAEGDGIKIVTLRNRAFKALDEDTSRSGDVIEASAVLSEDDITTKVESFEAKCWGNQLD